MKANLIITVESVIDVVNHVSKEIDGKFLPCRPEGFWGLRHRIKAAWLVFTGRADALIWPGGQ